MLKQAVTKIVKNKGTGAGGKNTTLNGGGFEKKTSIEDKLLEHGFIKKNFNKPKEFYYEKQFDNKTLIYISQWGLRTFMEELYNLSAIRKPDEAFITIDNSDKPKKTIVKILEKKYQSREGSVDTKLWAGPGIKREYELYYNNKFEIEYCFSLSKYLENKMKSSVNKWVLLNKIFDEHNIKSFYYDKNPKYYDEIINWGFGIKLN